MIEIGIAIGILLITVCLLYLNGKGDDNIEKFRYRTGESLREYLDRVERGDRKE